MFLSNRGSFRPETSGAYTLRRRGRRRPKSGSAIGACAVARLAGSGGPIGDYYGSANMAPAVAVHHGARPLPPGREGVEQRPVGERGRGPGADPPAGGAAVVAVHHGAQVDLAGGHAELGDVGDPQLVGGRRREVPGHQVRRGRRDLPLVGAPPPAPPPVVDHLEPLLPHQPAHDLLGRAPPLAAQARPYRAVAPVAAALLEQLPHPPAQGGVLVGAREPGPPVLIGAPRYPQESGDLSEGPPGRRAQSLAQLALSPVRHRSRVRACPF